MAYKSHHKYLTFCSCGRTTTKSYSRTHGGKCKTCVGGAPAQSHDDILREGGFEDTMGISPDCLEAYQNGGSYGGNY